MTYQDNKKIVILIVTVLPILLAVSCFLYPPEIRYSSYLVPKIDSTDRAYLYDEDTKEVFYDLGGSSIVVKYMTDQDLNNLFPEESSFENYSTNPYTYGNWINPDLGYTSNRFTVFQVTIINRTFAKMKLNPTEVFLKNDLGEELYSYSISIAAAKYGNSFENYYKSLRGQSGNDHYRYEMQIGMVRGKNYGLDEVIFRGDSYSGLVSFDILKPEVSRIRLVLNDVIYRFDAFNRPADVMTISFNFERIIEKKIITREMRLIELEREKVRIGMTGPQQLVGSRVNDAARNSRGIDKVLEEHVGEMEKCFLDRYKRNEVEPGNLTLSFTIESDGTISSQNVTKVLGIKNEDFMNCVLDIIRIMKYEEIVDMPTTGAEIVKGPAKPVNVTYPLDFSIYIEE